MRLVAIGDNRPTSQAYAVRDEISAAIDEQLRMLQLIWDEQLPALNARITDQGIVLIATPEI